VAYPSTWTLFFYVNPDSQHPDPDFLPLGVVAALLIPTFPLVSWHERPYILNRALAPRICYTVEAIPRIPLALLKSSARRSGRPGLHVTERSTPVLRSVVKILHKQLRIPGKAGFPAFFGVGVFEGEATCRSFYLPL